MLTTSFRQANQQDRLRTELTATRYQHSYIRGIRVERLAGGPLPP